MSLLAETPPSPPALRSAWSGNWPAPLIPDWLKQRWLLLVAGTLPQLVLLWLNLLAYHLISGEVGPEQHRTCLTYFYSELALLVGVTALALWPRGARKLRLEWTGPLLAGAVALLWGATAQMSLAIPVTVSRWMLDPEGLLSYQFIFVMPLVFHAGMRLACTPLRLTAGEEIGWSLAALVLVPTGCWLVFLSFSELHLGRGWNVPLLGVGLLATMLVLGAFGRVCARAYVSAVRQGPISLGVLSGAVGLALPLGGLWLNALIPFPADFQSWPVYTLAALNGGLLLLPRFRHPRLHRAVWLAQAALFPFTLYFFAVMLPYLPLSLLAMLAFGSGFLILAPAALFLLHGQRLVDGFRHEVRLHGARTPTLLLATMLAVLPVLFIAEAVTDRVVLRGALDYLYSPNYRHPAPAPRHLGAIRRSLEHLRDAKAGLQLPFLTDFYNWAVFNNLVLPDEKMEAMYRAFFGTALQEAKGDRISILGGGQPTRNRSLWREITTAPETSSVVLDNLTTSVARDGGAERATMKLAMRNTATPAPAGSWRQDEPAEFVTEIKVPEGVFVSGFWLKIGPDRTPGKLFEKKTAMWVYEKISTRTRRDPGILVYTDATTLQLRVFPFAPGEQRQVELEFIYPAALHPLLQVGEQRWQGPGVEASVNLVETEDGAVVLSPEAVAALPVAKRTPYLHFIVNRAAAAAGTEQQTLEAMHTVAARFPEASRAAVTYANFEEARIVDQPRPLAELDLPTLRRAAARLPRRGGFLYERAIKQALLAYHDRLAQAGPGAPELQEFPLIVLLHTADDFGEKNQSLEQFANLLQTDTAVFCCLRPDGSLEDFQWDGGLTVFSNLPKRSMAILQKGEAVALCSTEKSEPQVVHFGAGAGRGPLRVWKDGAFQPLATTATFSAETAYGQGTAAWQKHRAAIFDPSLGHRGLVQIVATSRATGIMLPATSYIVVENSAQLKMLEAKEKQKLGNSTALEFEETPEPAAAALLAAGGAYLLSRRRRAPARVVRS